MIFHLVTVKLIFSKLLEKIMFIYQYNTMKRIYQRYGTHLIMMGVTYKTTKICFTSPIPCLLKEVLITRYVETNLWLTDGLSYLHIKNFIKMRKTFIVSWFVIKKRFCKYQCLTKEHRTLCIKFYY